MSTVFSGVYTALRVIRSLFDDELCSLFDKQLMNKPVDIPPWSMHVESSCH